MLNTSNDHRSSRFYLFPITALLLLLLSTVSKAEPTAYVDEAEFHNAIRAYASRNRRFGNIDDSDSE